MFVFKRTVRTTIVTGVMTSGYPLFDNVFFVLFWTQVVFFCIPEVVQNKLGPLGGH